MNASRNITSLQISTGHETERQTREYLGQFGDEIVDESKRKFFGELEVQYVGMITYREVPNGYGHFVGAT